MTTEIDNQPMELTAEEAALAEAPYDGMPGGSDSAINETTDGIDGEDAVDDSADGMDPVGEQDTETEDAEADGEPAAPAAEEPKFDEADIARAKALGMEDDELEDFGSARALKRHLALAEKVAELTKEPEKETEPVSSQDDTKAEPKADELLDISLYDGTNEDFAEDAFDERSLGIAKAVRREQELRLETQRELDSLKQFVAQVQQEKLITQFSDAVDGLGNPELGEARDSRGRFVSLSKEQIEARSKLFAEVEKVAAEQQKAGKTGLTWEDTVAEAGKRIGLGKAKPSKADALQRQSAQRRPVSSGSSSARPTSRAHEPDSAEEIAEDPAIVAWWAKNAAQ